MRVLWTHNFDPAPVSSGVFMHELCKQVRDLGVDVDMRYTGYLRDPLRMLSAICRLRRTSRAYDLVHAQFGSACGFSTSFAPGRKLLTLRGTDLLGMDTGTWLDLAHGLACRAFTRTSLRSFDVIVVMSRRMRTELVEKFAPQAAVEVLPDGIDLSAFRPVDRVEARRQLGEGSDHAPWVLFSSVSGAGSSIKRPALARAAFDRFKRAEPRAKFKFLCGQPHELVPLWVNASDVVLLTSTREGWPNIIKEALACNVPFVSTDVSDLREIAEAEPSCFVVDAEPGALAEALQAAVGSGRKADLRKYAGGMDIEAVGRRLKAIYEGMLSGESPGRRARAYPPTTSRHEESR